MVGTRVALSLLVAAMISAHAARAEETCTKIVATGHPEYPVMASKDGDRIAGAAPRLVEEIAKTLDIPLETQYMGTWAQAQAATREGKADMIIGVYYNNERAEYLDYVQPPFVYDPVQVFVVNYKTFDYAGQDDLIGKKGVANEGESFGETFDAFLKDKLTVTRVDGLQAAFDALLSGEADYAIAPYYPGMAQLIRLGLEERIRPLEPELLSEEMFVAFAKTSPCAKLAPKFGEGIEKMTEDGSFRELVSDAIDRWSAAEGPRD